MHCNPAEIPHGLVSDFAIFAMAGRATKWEAVEGYILPRVPGASFGGLVIICDTRLSCALHTLHRARLIMDADQRAAVFSALHLVVVATTEALRRSGEERDGDLADAVRDYFSRIIQAEHNAAREREAGGVVSPMQPKLRKFEALGLLVDFLILGDKRAAPGEDSRYALFHHLMGAPGDLGSKIKNEASKIEARDREDPLVDRIRRAGASRFVNAAVGILPRVAPRHLQGEAIMRDDVGSTRQFAGTRRAS